MHGDRKDSDPQERKIRELEQKVTSLEGVVGRQKLETDFLSAALRHVEAGLQQKDEIGAIKSTPKSPAGQRRKAN
jgi:hypothetical protein